MRKVNLLRLVSVPMLVAGAGNSFLGGFGAGLVLAGGNIIDGTSRCITDISRVLSIINDSDSVRDRLGIIHDRTGRTAPTYRDHCR